MVVPKFSEPVLRAHGTVIYGMCVSRQNLRILYRAESIHIRYSLQMEVGIYGQHHHNNAVRTQVDDHCRKVQWPCQRCAKVTAANRQAMLFKLDNHLYY